MEHKSTEYIIYHIHRYTALHLASDRRGNPTLPFIGVLLYHHSDDRVFKPTGWSFLSIEPICYIKWPIFLFCPTVGPFVTFVCLLEMKPKIVNNKISHTHTVNTIQDFDIILKVLISKLRFSFLLICTSFDGAGENTQFHCLDIHDLIACS